jgi:hypothetical protein
MGQENWSMTHGFYAQMGGFAVNLIPERLGDNLNCEIGYIQTDSIRRYLKQGRLNPNTWITEQEIQDKGKSDSLGKSLTILQLSWLLVQCSARLLPHLPLTTLELSTLRTWTFIQSGRSPRKTPRVHHTSVRSRLRAVLAQQYLMDAPQKADTVCPGPEELH